MIATDEFNCVLYAIENHVATITLNRPERRNALNRRAYAELEAAFRHATADSEVRCVIVTGADPAFCSGEDVKEMMTGEIGAHTAPRTPQPTPAAMAALECVDRWLRYRVLVDPQQPGGHVRTPVRGREQVLVGLHRPDRTPPPPRVCKCRRHLKRLDADAVAVERRNQ